MKQMVSYVGNLDVPQPCMLAPRNLPSYGLAPVRTAGKVGIVSLCPLV